MASDPFPPEFLPPDSPTVTPDDDLRALDNELLPGDDDLIVGEDPPPPVGRSWYFDFYGSETGDPGFLLPEFGQGPIRTYGEETLRQWIEKCMRTARGAHPVYPSDYGMESPWEFYGRTLESADYAVIEARVRDALTFHPRIVDITDFSADQQPDDDVLVVNFVYLLDDGSSGAVEDLVIG